MSIRPLALSLLACAAALVAVGAPAHAAQRDDKAAEALGWRLGVQAWTCNFMTTCETIDLVKSLGLKYIELYPGQKFSKDSDAKVSHDMAADVRDQLKAYLAAAGVKAVNYGVVGLSKNEEQSRKVFEFAKALGLETIVSEPQFDAFDTIEKLVKEYDIKVALHDHPKPSIYWNPDIVLEHVSKRDKRIGACADVGHWVSSGLNPAECLKKLEGRVICLHYKDTKDGKCVRYGTGGGDFPAQFAELHRQGFKGVFSLEYEAGKKGQELFDHLTEAIVMLDSFVAGKAAAPKP